MEELKLKYGFKADKLWDGTWSVGIAMSHGDGETYVYINLFKWSIAIGKMYLTR